MTQSLPSDQGNQGRGPLPRTRRSETHQVIIGNRDVIFVIGFYEDGYPGEVSITLMGNSPVEVGMTNAVSALIALLLQRGVPVAEIAYILEGKQFEPSGRTSNPEIPNALSITDYLGRYLQQRWGSKDKQPRLPRIIDITPLCKDCNKAMQWFEGDLICRSCGYIRP